MTSPSVQMCDQCKRSLVYLLLYLQTPVLALVGNDACWSQIAREQIPMLGRDTACNLAVSTEKVLIHLLSSNSIGVRPRLNILVKLTLFFLFFD